MADTKDNEDKKSAYESDCKKDFQEDWDVHKTYIENFDAYEAMLVGMVYDSVSKSVEGSKITDSYAATLAMERAARVMAKLPDGMTEAISKSDQGKASFMEILRQKWIYPNANSQHPFQVKLRLWQLYSSVYGYMPMFYDWNIANNGYVGPDCWLWNPRNFIPQQGRVSLADMDYVTATTWVSKKYLQGILDNDSEVEDGWDRDAIRELVEIASSETADVDQHQDTVVTRDRTPQAQKKGIQLATRYEAGEDGEWITFAPDHSHIEVRRLPNPHKNGRIPFVIKYSQPLFDSFYGLGDFQRAKPLQFARDGLTNFYFKGIKMNLIQPIVANANGVLKHTLDYREGGVMMETIPNSIRTLGVSNAGLSTYQGAQSNLTGSLLSLFGTQNASIPGAESLNPSQGKTPAAINMYSQKEATRDGQEREFMERAIEELTDGFFSLVANIGTESVPINLFATEIQEIAKVSPDLLDWIKPNETGTGGEMTIDPEVLKGVDYRFNITPGTTAKVSEEEQLNAIERLMGTVAKYINMIQDDPRIEIDFPGLLNAYEELSGIKGVKDFVIIKNAPSPTELALMEEIQGLQQESQQMQMQLQQAGQMIQKSQAETQEAIQIAVQSKLAPGVGVRPPQPQMPQQMM